MQEDVIQPLFDLSSAIRYIALAGNRELVMRERPRPRGRLVERV